MKKTLLQISVILILFSCGDKGIEGFVGEKIIIAAKETEGKTDLDYTWILIEQPDGSLLNSSDLNPQTDKNKMNLFSYCRIALNATEDAKNELQQAGYNFINGTSADDTEGYKEFIDACNLVNNNWENGDNKYKSSTKTIGINKELMLHAYEIKFMIKNKKNQKAVVLI